MDDWAAAMAEQETTDAEQAANVQPATNLFQELGTGSEPR
jgi:flagellar motor switch protein FliN/FliY